MSSNADELKLDIEELNQLLKQANRQRSKNLISLELRRLQTGLSKLFEEDKGSCTKSTRTVSNPQKCYEVKLNNYNWDQTMVKFSLKDVHQLPKEAVTCNFTEKSLDGRVLGLDNRNYGLIINNLSEEIDVDHSAVKVKSDTVVVSLTKKVPKNWSHITGIEKRIKQSKSSMVSNMNDEGANLINLMKKRYQEGDDEVKKIIAKAWIGNC